MEKISFISGRYGIMRKVEVTLLWIYLAVSIAMVYYYG